MTLLPGESAEMKIQNEAEKRVEIEQLRNQLSLFFNLYNFSIAPINNGASVRKYYMLTFSGKTYFPQKKVVLMHIPLNQLQIADDYLNISYYLRRNKIPRPRLFELNREHGWIFLAPAAGEQLNLYLQKNPGQTDSIYAQLIDFLVTMQHRAKFEKHCPAFQRYFDAEKYLYEFQFHVKENLFEHFVQHRFTPAEEKIFQEFSTKISNFLDSLQPVFVHRDFQSSNIFYKTSVKKTPFQIIDFQDARAGSYVYDLVSLLWDSYVEIPDTVRQRCLSDFYDKQVQLRKHFSFEHFKKSVDYTVIQRKLHDAGAFIFSFRSLQNRDYLRYIRSSSETAIEMMATYPEFKASSEMFTQILGENDDKNNTLSPGRRDP